MAPISTKKEGCIATSGHVPPVVLGFNHEIVTVPRSRNAPAYQSSTQSGDSRLSYCDSTVFSERELMFTFAIGRRASVCLSVECNVRAPYSGD